LICNKIFQVIDQKQNRKFPQTKIKHLQTTIQACKNPKAKSFPQCPLHHLIKKTAAGRISAPSMQGKYL